MKNAFTLTIFVTALLILVGCDAGIRINSSSNSSNPGGPGTRKNIRPSRAFLGHWQTIVGAPGMHYNKWDFELYVEPLG